MNFQEQIILENDKVLLRPLEVNDIQYLKSFVIKEPDIWSYSLIQTQSVEDLQQYISTAVEAKYQGKEYAFIVYDKLTNEYAGSTRYYDIQLPFKTLQLGYTWYGKQFQGSHVNKNCKLLLLEYAFEHMGIERVEFRADNNNERSKRAMESIGCITEGVLRNHLPTLDGGRRDSIILSILKDEWHSTVKNNLIKKCLL
jgi:N-acetyltransferase